MHLFTVPEEKEVLQIFRDCFLEKLKRIIKGEGGGGGEGGKGEGKGREDREKEGKISLWSNDLKELLAQLINWSSFSNNLSFSPPIYF